MKFSKVFLRSSPVIRPLGAHTSTSPSSYITQWYTNGSSLHWEYVPHFFFRDLPSISVSFLGQFSTDSSVANVP